MTYRIRNKLKEKGWNQKDINEAISIIEHARENKHPKIKILDKSVYWISLIVIIAANFIISLSLLPILLALNSIWLYLILAIIGFSFGLLFELLIRTMEHLEPRHHVFFAIIIPVIAVINIIFMVSFSNGLEAILGIQNLHNPIFTGIAYSAFFMLPYIAYRFLLLTERI